MKAFLAIAGKGKTLAPGMLTLIPALAAQALPFRHMPYRAEDWRSAGGQLALFSWDNDLETASTTPLIAVDGERAVTLTGYVSHPARADAWGVGGLTATAPLRDASVARWGGMFALVEANAAGGEIRAWTSTSRAAPLYYVDNPAFVAVGTRALLLALLQAPRPVYAPGALVPYLIRGRFASDHTPFQGVAKVPPNTSLRATRGGVTLRPTDEFAHTCGTVDPTAADYDVLAALLLASVQPLRGRHVICSLTGGKDSRIAIAALHHAGVDVEARTTGFAGNPDVVVAERVAAALGVPHGGSATTTPGANGEVDVTVDPHSRACQVLFGSDGMLSAYENLLPARRFNSTYVSVGGHGGEVALRDSFETGPISWEMAAAVLENYYLTTPEIFRPEAFGDHKALLRDWLAAERASGASPNIALDRFAVRFDLGVSGIGPTVTEIGRYGLYPLMDNQVTKAGFQARQDVKQRDDLLTNLLARLAPQLLDVPFAYKRWNFEREGPRPGDEAGWARRAPITAPAAQRATFNWRHRWAHELYDTFYEQVFGDARAEAMFEVLDREALRAWFGKRRGTTDPNGASVAWAAYSASVMLSNDWLDPDAPGTGEITIPLPPTS